MPTDSYIVSHSTVYGKGDAKSLVLYCLASQWWWLVLGVGKLVEREVKEKGVAVIQAFIKVSNFILRNTMVTNKSI